MDKLEMTPEQQLAFDGFIDVLVQIFYNYLILFHDAYDQLPDIWKKKFFQSFIQEIRLYPEQQENGQVLKSMKFKFPVFYNGQTIEEIRWDKENTVETVWLLIHG